jgi:hypothetical protein
MQYMFKHNESTRFNKGVSIIMNFNLMDIYIYKQKHGSHINIFLKDKINYSFKTIYFKLYLEKKLH